MNNTSALPRAGEIDPSFPRIRVPNPIAGERDFSPDFQLLLPDGRSILGCQDDTYYQKPCLVRVLDDGTLDREFGDNGYSFIKFDYDLNNPPYLAGIYALPSGGYMARLEVPVRGERPLACPALACFTSDGKPEPSFGEEGLKLYELPAEPLVLPELLPLFRGRSKAVASSVRSRSEQRERFWSDSYGDLHFLKDGQFLLLGSVVDKTERTHRAYVMKLNADGEFDPTFNGSGYMEPERTTWFAPLRMLPQGEQFLISCRFPGTCAVARYNQDGSLDRSFGNDGYFADLGPYGYSYFQRLLLTASNDIICVGRAGGRNFAEGRGITSICKINADGKRVLSFNQGETVHLEPSEPDDVVLACFDAILDDEGRVVLGGRQMAPFDAPVILTSFLARLLDDGSPDQAFGPTGIRLNKDLTSLGQIVQDPGGGYYSVTYIFPEPQFLARYFG